ncbi:MAG: hypothetical protein Q4G39_02620 [Brachymonas sp.]|nr:hypothetical protein [Brachymonas sp.]
MSIEKTIDQTVDKVQDTSEQAAKTASRLFDDAKASTQKILGKAEDMAKSAGKSLNDQLTPAYDQARTYVSEKPVQSVAMAAAAGAALAAAFTLARKYSR